VAPFQRDDALAEDSSSKRLALFAGTAFLSAGALAATLGPARRRRRRLTTVALVGLLLLLAAWLLYRSSGVSDGADLSAVEASEPAPVEVLDDSTTTLASAGMHPMHPRCQFRRRGVPGVAAATAAEHASAVLAPPVYGPVSTGALSDPLSGGYGIRTLADDGGTPFAFWWSNGDGGGGGGGLPPDGEPPGGPPGGPSVPEPSAFLAFAVALCAAAARLGRPARGGRRSLAPGRREFPWT
jgi:hypothetical protein